MTRVQFLAGVEFFLFTTYMLVVGPTQPSAQRVLGALSIGLKQPECGAEHI